MKARLDMQTYAPLTKVVQNYWISEKQILAAESLCPELVEKKGKKKFVLMDKLGLATYLTINHMHSEGFKLSGRFLDNLNGWFSSKKLSRAADYSNTIMLIEPIRFWHACDENPVLNNKKIRGAALRKEFIDYSQNGEPGKTYSCSSIREEIQGNLETAYALISRVSRAQLKIHQDKEQLLETRVYDTEQCLSIDQVWQQFHRTRDDYFRNLLMEHYRSQVRYCAERLHSKLPDKVELDDLVSAGIFGLIDAIDDFNPYRGVKFETYCSPRIRGAILDELREMDWVPRLVRARSHQLAKATKSLESHLGRSPTEKELAKKLNMNMEEYNRLRRDANAVGLISLDTKYGDDNGEKNIREIDTITDPNGVDPVAEAQKKDLLYLLTKGITRAERLIVVLYYYEELTMKEIGQTLDLSESRVSQMHSSIIDRLKAKMYDRKDELLGRERTTKPTESTTHEYTVLSDIIREEAGCKRYKEVKNFIMSNPNVKRLTERTKGGRRVHSGNTKKLRSKIRAHTQKHVD